MHRRRAGAALRRLAQDGRERPVDANAVPVSIVSSRSSRPPRPTIPSDELVTEDAATAPVGRRRPSLCPTRRRLRRRRPPRRRRRTPRRRRRARPRRVRRPTPPRPTPEPPKRPADPAASDDARAPAAAAAARGVARSRRPGRPPRAATRPGTRPATGQQGAGQRVPGDGPAGHGHLQPGLSELDSCPATSPARDDLRIQMDVTLDARRPHHRGPDPDRARGRTPSGAPPPTAPCGAIRQTAPFDVPQGFPGGAVSARPSMTERACRQPVSDRPDPARKSPHSPAKLALSARYWR